MAFCPLRFPTLRRPLARFAIFLSWLQSFDSLYCDIGADLGYASRYDDAGCNSALSHTAYAFYNPNEGKTYLMPWAIHLLKNREYQKVAQILAHERAISELITAT